MICGHIHHAAMHDDFGIAIYNCGDWVESCTALAEHHDGRFEIIRWTDARKVPNSVNLIAPDIEDNNEMKVLMPCS